ncbi:unnamed protein product [Menidia menidia]|uniref:(Atlantic silverside) hypothetical protein n=1 Tax=Menidia menidia TaxID=238744 RepID=A0A8S4BGS0_9TELE|nr:unnamed protein product [Menidia menidia]
MEGRFPSQSRFIGGVVSSDSQYPPTSGRQGEYLSSGPMCRYAQDLLPLLRIMAGANASMLSLDTKVDLRKLRFFSIPHDGGCVWTNPVSRELLDVQRRVVQRLEADLGVKVQQVALPRLRYSFQIWDTYMSLPDKDGKRDQMYAAQEMFKTANKVTRPEKALILGFMAGSRENPCPEQGDIIQIKLSEHTEVLPKADGTGSTTMLVDTVFEMNYSTGQWTRLKKYKPITNTS